MRSLLLAYALLFSGSVLTKLLSKTILFNQMSLNPRTISLSEHFHNFLAELVILPGQGSIPILPLLSDCFDYLL